MTTNSVLEGAIGSGKGATTRTPAKPTTKPSSKTTGKPSGKPSAKDTAKKAPAPPAVKIPPRADLVALKQKLDEATVAFTEMRRKNDELRMNMDNEEREAEIAIREAHQAYHGAR